MAVATAKKRKTRYEFRPGFRVREVDAATVGSRIEVLKRQGSGQVRPCEVVADARPEEAPLHPCFTWDNARAAELYREDEARHLIRSYVVVTEPGPGDEIETSCIANVCVVEDDRRVYVSTARAMDDPELRVQVIDEAEAMLRGVVARYRGIPDLIGYLRAALDRLELDG